MTQALLTASLTVFGGIVAFILGQIFIVLFLERIRKQARTVEEIAEALVLYAREYTAPVNRDEDSEDERKRRLEVSNEIRRLSAVLRSTAQTLKWYPLFQSSKMVLPKENVLSASKALIGLSNSVPPPAIAVESGNMWRKEVENALRLVDNQE